MYTSTHPTRGRRHATAIRYGVAAMATLAVAAVSAMPAHASNAGPKPLETQLAPPPPPAAAAAKQYNVRALHFKAIDESGWDRAGSDEPYWVFSSVGSDGTSSTRHTKEFSNVDSGDVRDFAPGDRYIFPQPAGSAPAPTGIGMSFQVWESDQGSKATTVSKTGQYFQAAGAISALTPAPAWVGVTLGYVGTATNLIGQLLADDLMGSQTLAYSKSELDARLPAPGTFFDQTLNFTDGDADYSLTLRVKRTA
jgi:hypothetical protein